MANPRNKKEVPEIEAVPSGTAFSHLSPDGLRTEYKRVMGKSPDGLSFQDMITQLLFQFEVQKTLTYQDEVYKELNPAS